ncbi:MAG: HEAT repeat domain-containing protein [Planctomycetota bacterium]|nr:HEAT repeat domain-containing protein [Planctomycetota bacterium]
MKSPMAIRIALIFVLGALLLWNVRPDVTLAEKIQLFVRSGMSIVDTRETFSGIVTVSEYEHENPDLSRVDLYEDSVYIGGVSPENRYLKLAGLMSSVYGLEENRGLVINYGTGAALQSMVRCGFEQIDVCASTIRKFELQEYFRRANGLALNAKSVQKHVCPTHRATDLLPGPYNAIVLEPEPIFLDGNWETYSKSFFSRASGALEDGGIMVYPFSVASPGLFASAVRSMASVFDDVHVFAFRGGVVLVGRKGAQLRFNIERMSELVEQEVPHYMRELNVQTPYGIISGFMTHFTEGDGASWHSPKMSYREEWVLLSGTKKQALTFRALLESRLSLEEVAALFKEGHEYDKDALERFYVSGEELMKGMAEYVGLWEKESPKKAADHFQTAFSLNQGDLEAKWFFNYLQERGVVKTDEPEEEDELEKHLRTVLTSTDDRERVLSLIKLRRFTGDFDVSRLMGLLNDTNEEVRAEFAALLGLHKSPLCRSAVVRLLGDTSTVVLRSAMRSAVMQNNSQAVGKLLELMGNAEVSDAAVSALMKLGTKEAADRFAAMLSEADDGQKLRLMRGLAKSGTAAHYDALLTCAREGPKMVTDGALSAIREIALRYDDADAVELFLPFLNDENTSVRFQAVRAIGELGGKESFQRLKAIYTESPEDIDSIILNTYVLEAMAKCGGAEALDTLVEQADSTDRNVSRAAISSMGYIRDERALAKLRRIAREGDLHRKLAALEGFSNAQPAIALKLLLEYTSDPEDAVVNRAVKLIARLKTGESRAVILEYLESGNPAQMLAAARSAGETGHPALFEPLMQLLNSGRPDLVTVAAQSAIKVADEGDLVRFCTTALDHSSQDVRIAAARALSTLPHGTDDSFVRTSLVEALDTGLSRSELSAITQSLRKLDTVPEAPIVKRTSDDREISVAVRWWRSRYGLEE